MPAILDPLLDVRNFEERIGALEQRPKVVEPLYMESLPGAPLVFQWYSPTTSATFVTAWETYCPRVMLPSLAVVHSVTDGGASGEHRIVMTAGANIATSSTQAYATGSARFQSLGWIHGLPRWTDDLVRIELQHRRTAGAGILYTGRPVFVQIDSRACTVAGAWYLTVWLP